MCLHPQRTDLSLAASAQPSVGLHVCVRTGCVDIALHGADVYRACRRCHGFNIRDKLGQNSHRARLDGAALRLRNVGAEYGVCLRGNSHDADIGKRDGRIGQRLRFRFGLIGMARIRQDRVIGRAVDENAGCFDIAGFHESGDVRVVDRFGYVHSHADHVHICAAVCAHLGNGPALLGMRRIVEGAQGQGSGLNIGIASIDLLYSFNQAYRHIGHDVRAAHGHLHTIDLCKGIRLHISV